MLIRNINKVKKLPGTKSHPKYFGPYEVEKVTKGHVIVNNNMKGKQFKNVPFLLTKKYLQRNSSTLLMLCPILLFDHERIGLFVL